MVVLKKWKFIVIQRMFQDISWLVELFAYSQKKINPIFRGMGYKNSLQVIFVSKENDTFILLLVESFNFDIIWVMGLVELISTVIRIQEFSVIERTPIVHFSKTYVPLQKLRGISVLGCGFKQGTTRTLLSCSWNHRSLGANISYAFAFKPQIEK